MFKHSLPILLTSLLFHSISSAYICFPPPGPLPFYRDCRVLIDGIDLLSHQPSENIAKHWGRHLPTAAYSEQLPRWYYIHQTQQSSTCLVVVDVGGTDLTTVGVFPLRNVVVAASIAFFQCLVGKQQIGLEFATDEAPVYVKVMKLEGRPPSGLLRVADGEGVRRVVLPDQKVLHITDGRYIREVMGKNISEAR
ncbi:MAG: hypothetical protein Q9209_004892 [Squamulea sp. 1 TL-2023]